MKKKILFPIILLTTLLLITIVSATWHIINNVNNQVPSEYFPYEVDSTQETIYNGKGQSIKIGDEAGDEIADTEDLIVEYYKYSWTGSHGQINHFLTKLDTLPKNRGIYIVKIFREIEIVLEDNTTSIEKEEIYNVRFDINPRCVNVRTYTDTEFIYFGQDTTNVTYKYELEQASEDKNTGVISGDIIEEVNLKLGTSYKKYDDVGNYSIEIQEGYLNDEFDNYYFVEDKEDLVVKPLPLLAKWDTTTLKYTYDGKFHKPETILTTDISGIDLETAFKMSPVKGVLDTENKNGVINADTYTINCISVDNSNYYLPYTEATSFIIDKCLVSFAWNNDKLVFDATNQHQTAYLTAAGSASVDTNGDSFLLYQNEETGARDEVTISYSSKGEILANVDKNGTSLGESLYSISVAKLSNSNYDFGDGTKEIDYKIYPAPLTLEWSSESVFTFNNDVQIVEAEESGIFNNYPSGLSFTGEQTNANYVDESNLIQNFNKYYSTAVITSTNYYLPDNYMHEFKILQLPIEMQWDEQIEFNYSGQKNSHCPTGSVVVPDGYPDAGLSISGGQTNANCDHLGNQYEGEQYNYAAVSTISNTNYKLIGSTSCDFTVLAHAKEVNISQDAPNDTNGSGVSYLASSSIFGRNAAAPLQISYTYIGVEFTPTASYTGELFEGDECVIYVNYVNSDGTYSSDGAIDVGTYLAKTSGVSNLNYSIAEEKEVNIIIKPRPIYVSWDNLAFEYTNEDCLPTVQISNVCDSDIRLDENGNPVVYVLVDNTYSKKNANITYTTKELITSVGEYEVTLSKRNNTNSEGEEISEYAIFGERAHNYIFADESECSNKFTIRQAPLTINALEKSIVYGDAPSLSTVDNIEVIGLQNETISVLKGLDYHITYNQFDDITNALRGDSYTAIWKDVDNTNYEITYNEAAFIVTAKPIEIVWDSEITHVYSSSSWAPTVALDGLVNNDDVFGVRNGYEIDSNEKTGRKYTANVTGLSSTDGNEQELNYYISNIELTQSFTITPRPVTITWGETVFTYSSKEIFPTYSFENVLNNEKLDETKAGTETNANRNSKGKFGGTYTASITTIGNLNYMFDVNADKEEEFFIDALGITVSWNNPNFTYTGKEQLPTVTSLATIFASDVSSVDTSISVASDSTVTGFIAGTWAGSHTATATLIGSKASNYEIIGGSTKGYEIQKAPLQFTLKDNSIIYGAEPIDNGYTVSGFVPGEDEGNLGGSISYTHSYTQFNNIGKYDINASGFSSNNYEITYVKSILTVNPRPVVLEFTDKDSYVYNQGTHYPNVAVVNTVNNDVVEVTISGFINAGTHKSIPSALSNSNYTLEGTNFSHQFTIAPRPIIINWSGHENLVYNNTVQKISISSNDILTGDTVNYDVQYTNGDGKTAGSHTVVASIDNSNYIISNNDPLTYNIDKKDININWSSDREIVYCNAEVMPEVEVTGFIDGDSSATVTYNSKGRNVGNYTVNAVLSDDTNYYIASGATCDYEITPKAITITWADVDYTYRKDHIAPIPTAEGLIDGDTTASIEYSYSGDKLTDGKAINAGKYTAMATVVGDHRGNYTITSGASKDFTITPKEITIKWGELSFKYTGEVITPTATAEGLFEGDQCELTVSGGTNEPNNEGEFHTATVTGLSNPNYKLPANVTAQFEIIKVTLKVTIYGGAKFEYGNELKTLYVETLPSELEEDTIYYTIEGFINGHSFVDLSGTLPLVTDYVKFADAKVYEFSIGDNGFTHAIYEFDYVIYNNNNTFEVTPKVIYENNLTWDSDLTYNGENQLPTASFTTLNNDECKVIVGLVDGTDSKNANVTYTAKAIRLSNENYQLAGEFEKEFTIKPKKVTITWSEETSFVYTSEEQKPSATVEGIIDSSDVCYVEFSGGAVNVGDNYTATAKLVGTGAGNYTLEGTTTSCSYSITPKEITITWDGYTGLIYNGKVQEITATSTDVYSDDNVKFTITYTTGGKDATSHTATVTIDSNNYTIKVGTEVVEYTIAPKPITITWSEETSFVYTSEELKPSATVEGIYSDDICSVVFSGAQVNVGNNYVATASLVGTGSSNYTLEGAVTTCKFSITPKPITIIWGGYEDLIYNNTVQEITATSTDVYSDDNIEFDIDYTTGGKTAGSHSAVVSINSNNYSINNPELTYSIARKEIKLVWDELRKFTYCNDNIMPEVEVSGIIKDDTSVSISYINKGRNVGSHTVTAVLSDETNYYIASGETCSYEITPKSITITWADVNYEYCKDYIGPIPTVTGLIIGDTTVIITYSGEGLVDGKAINVGDYKVVASVDGDYPNNYTITSGSSYDFTITPKEITIKWGETTFKYTGEVITPTATAEGLFNGDECILKVSGGSSQLTLDGEYHIATVIDLSNPNYKLPTDDDSLSARFYILKVTLTVTIYGGAKFEYGYGAATRYIEEEPSLIDRDAIYYTIEGFLPGHSFEDLTGRLPIRTDYSIFDNTRNNIGTYSFELMDEEYIESLGFKHSVYDFVYEIYNNNNKFEIVPRVIYDLTWDTNLTYNSQAQLPTATFDTVGGDNAGVIWKDECNVIVELVNGTNAINVGTYTAKAVGLSNPNYVLYKDDITKEFSISPCEITISWNGLSHTYDSNYYLPNITINGVYDVDKDFVSVAVDQSYARKNANAIYQTETLIDGFEAYAVAISKDSDGNYIITGEKANNYVFASDTLFETTFTISQALLTIIAKEATIVYGDVASLSVDNHLAHNLQENDTISDLTGLTFTSTYNQYDDISTQSRTYTATWTGVTNTNYKVVYEEAALIVTAKPVTIVWDSVITHVYDGIAWAPSATINGIVSTDNLTCVVEGMETDANVKSERPYTATVTGLTSTNGKASNYIISDETITTQKFTITPRVVTIDWLQTEFTYNSEAIFPTYKFSEDLTDTILAISKVGAQTNANRNSLGQFGTDYNASVTIGNLNYKFADGLTVEVEFYIDALGITVNWNNPNFTYTGQEQLPTITSLTGVLPADNNKVGAGIESVTSDSTVEDFVAGTWAGMHKATVKLTGDNASNYEITTGLTKEYEIKKATLTVTLNDHTIIYGDEPTNNGYTFSAFVNGEDETVLGGSISYAYGYTQFGDIGKYDITATGLTSNNYDIKYVDSTLTVIAKEITITWSEHSGLIYNGQKQEIKATSSDVFDRDNVTYTIEYTTGGKDAKEHTAKVSINNSNYIIKTNETVEYSIAPKPITIIWSGHEGLIYNGKVQDITATSNDIESVDSVKFDVTRTSGDGISAGDHSVKVSIDNTNYTITNKELPYSIAKKNITITWDQVRTFEYKKEPLIPDAKVEGIVDDASVCTVKFDGAQTNVGDNYTATAYLDGSGINNYTLENTETTCTFSITPKEITINWGNLSFSYTGSPIKPNPTAEGLIGTDTCELTVSGEQTAPGKYIATVIGLSNPNYKLPSDVTEEFEILNTSLIVTIYADIRVVYGSELRFRYVENLPEEREIGVIYFTIEGFDDGDSIENLENYFLPLTTNYYPYDATNGNVGRYSFIINNDGYVDEKYSFEYSFYDNINEFEVVQRIITKDDLIWDESLEYNKESQLPTVTIKSDVLNGDSCSVEVELVNATEAINVGTYNANINKLSNDNYDFASDITIEFSITPIKIEFEWDEETLEHMYDGEPHVPTAIVKAGMIISGDEVLITVEGSQTDASSTAYVAQAIGTNNKNYVLKENGTTEFRIVPREIKVIWENTAFEYGNTPHLPSARLDNVCTSDIGKVSITVDESYARTNANITYSTRELISSVGEYQVALTKDSNGNYILSGEKAHNYVFASDAELSTTFTIRQAPLTITTKEVSIYYGDAPVLTDTDREIDGLINESSAVLTGLTYSITYKQYDDVTNVALGVKYEATWTGVTNTNYEITYVKAEFVVERLPITIGWDTVRTHVYDGNPWAPTATLNGLVNGDKVSCVVAGLETDTNAKTGRTYTARVTDLKSDDDKNQASNYLISNIIYTMEFTITPCPITVTWPVTAFDYDGGSKFPTYQFSNGLTKDNLAITESGAQTNANRNSKGKFATYTASVTIGNLNYKFTDGLAAQTEFYIDALGITVNWNNPNFTYTGKQQLPSVTSLTGVLTADNSQVGTSITVSSDSTVSNFVAGTWAGAHTATATLTGEKANNYEITTNITKGYEIKKATLTVTLNNKTITYGDAPVGNGYSSITGFKNGETVDTIGLSGSISYSYGGYTQYGDIGDYDITASGFTSNNYTFTYVKATLKVNPKPITVNWGTQTSFEYDGTKQSPSYTVVGIKEGADCVVSLNGASKDVGDYKAVIILSGTDAANYRLVNVSCDFSIYAKTLTITWNVTGLSYTSYEINPVKLIGIVTLDDVEDDVKPVFSEPIKNSKYYSNVSVISLTGADAGNYQLSNENRSNSFAVDKALPIITTYPTITDIFEGQDATINNDGQATINNGATIVNGKFEFAGSKGRDKTFNINGIVGQSYDNSIELEIKFTPTGVDAANYEIPRNTIKVTLKIHAVASIGYKGTYYGSIEAALNAASSGDVVYVLPNLKDYSGNIYTPMLKATTSNNGIIEVKSGVTLLLPYKDGAHTYENNLGYYEKVKSGSSNSVVSRMLVGSGVTLNVYGTLNISAKLNSGGDVGLCGVLMNNGIINIKNGANLFAYGYLKGDITKDVNNNITGGLVNVESGAKYTDVFRIYDWFGGKNAYAVNNEKVLPFQCYSFHNVSCQINIYSGAIFKAYAAIYGNDEWMLDQTINVIGNSSTSSSLFILDNGHIERTVADTTEVTNMNSSYISDNQKITQKEIFKFYGDFHDGSISISATISSIPVKISTGPDLAMPLGFIEMYLMSGTGSITQNSYKMLPGSLIYIAEGAIFETGSNVKTIFYDEYPDDFIYYKAKTTPENEGVTGKANSYSYQNKRSIIYNSDGTLKDGWGAKLIVAGELKINGYIGGTIHGEGKGKVTIANSSANIKLLETLRYEGQTIDVFITQINLSVATTKDHYVDAIGTINGVVGDKFTAGTTYYYNDNYDSWGTPITITYVTNHSQSLDAETIKYGSAGFIPTKLNSLSKDGYSVSWYTDSGFTNLYDGTVPLTTSTTLYAKWTPNEYNVSFDSQGGSSIASKKVTYTETYGTLTTPSKPGYVFTGWTLDGNVVTADTIVSNYEDHTLVATWKEAEYTVTFDSQGGSSVSDITVTFNSMYGSLPTPTLDGFLFKGWSYNGNIVTDKTVVTAKSNHTLVAQWEEITQLYKVTFNYPDGTTKVVEYNANSPYGALEQLTGDPGYTFAGWYYEEDNNIKIITSTDTVTKDVTLKPQFTPNTYLIVFDSNGGSGNMSNQTHTYDASLALSINIFTKAGYTFAGWLYDGTSYADEAEIKNLTINANDELTFVAQWTPISYTVKFDANGGTGSMSNQTHTYGTSLTLSANTFEKEGYYFVGWLYGDTIYGDEQSVSNLTTLANSEITLVAQWEENTYIVVFDGNGATEGNIDNIIATNGQTFTMPQNTYENPGYEFAGWSYNNTTYQVGASYTLSNLDNNSTVIFKAQWIPITYVIILTSVESDETSRLTITYGSKGEDGILKEPNFTYVGHFIYNWKYINKNNNTIEYYNTGDLVNDLTVMDGAELTLTAVWKVNTYIVSFNGNTAETGSVNKVEYTYGLKYNLPANNFKKTGYAFVGWNTETDGTGISYSDKAEVSNLTDKNGETITLYAQWLGYKVTFDANGGSCDESYRMYAPGETYNVRGSLPTPKRDSYNFTGWYDAKYGGNVIDVTKAVNGDITIYAHWEYNSCVAEGTLITLADGTRKPVEELKEGDLVIAWDFVNGKYVVTSILDHINHGYYETNIINLKFEDGTIIRVIEEHGFFNYTRNNWSMISEKNFIDFIGDEFVMQTDKIIGSEYKTVKLVDAFITYETIGVYSLFTSYTINCFAEGLLSITPMMQDSDGFTQYFEFGDNLKYDEKQMLEDIQKYGLYTYDEWKEYMTYDEFEAIGLKYLKVSVGKGLITEEEICLILNIRV